MFNENEPQHERLLTLGQLAAILQIPNHRLKYAIDQHHITPAMKVGILRVWTEADIPEIKRALEHVAANRRRSDANTKQG